MEIAKAWRTLIYGWGLKHQGPKHWWRSVRPISQLHRQRLGTSWSFVVCSSLLTSGFGFARSDTTEVLCNPFLYSSVKTFKFLQRTCSNRLIRTRNLSYVRFGFLDHLARLQFQVSSCIKSCGFFTFLSIKKM